MFRELLKENDVFHNTFVVLLHSLVESIVFCYHGGVGLQVGRHYFGELLILVGGRGGSGANKLLNNL